MNQDNSIPSVGNRSMDTTILPENVDSSKPFAYYPNMSIPQSYQLNGSLQDNNSMIMHDQMNLGQMTDSNGNVVQSGDPMQYHHKPITQLNSMPYLISPLLTPQSQLPHGHLVPMAIPNMNSSTPQQSYVPDSNFPQHSMLLSNQVQQNPNNGLPQPMPSTQMLLPPGLMLTNNNTSGVAGMPNIGMLHPMNTQQQILGMPIQQGGAVYTPNPYPLTGQPSDAQSGTKPIPGKPWHSPDDAPIRLFVCEQIVSLLHHRRPNAAEDWQQKLPNMGKRLEDALYMKAASLDEYKDINTLKMRLQQLAQSMNNKNAARPSGAPQQAYPTAQPSQQQPQQQQQMGQQQQQQQFQAQVPQIPQYVQQQQQQLQQAPQAGHTSRTLAAVSSQYPTVPVAYKNAPLAAGLGVSLPSMSTGASANGLNVVEGQQGDTQAMDESISMGGVTAYTQQMPQQMAHLQQQSKQVQQPSSNPQQQQQASSQGAYANTMQGDSDNLIMENIGEQTNSQLNPGGSQEEAGNNKRPQTQHSEEHRRQVLKQQQQRLLLLRHASKCPHENGRCPVTPHCASMKNLWKHIMGCKDQECKIPHCVSSRYVLSHYSKCKDVNCPVCGPVREAIRRNYQKSQLIIDMSNNKPAVPEAQPGEKRPRPSVSAGEKVMMTLPPAKKPNNFLVPEQKPRAPVTNNLLDPISCALYSFTNEQIKAHIQNIQEGMRLSASGIRDLCVPIVEELFKVPHAYVIFGTSVDPVALGLSDYYDIIKAPMDLGTVKKRLDMNGYRDINNFAFDVHLTFQNAMRYNPKNSDVYVLAKQLNKDFDTKFSKVVYQHEISMEEKRSNKDACLVCGEISLKFEPPVYYCNGKCGGQRIRRNSYFYSAGNNAYHWCTICFQELKENQLIQLPDCTISKAELAKNKKKHSEESEEPWVQCDTCERWVHQICGLFNGRRNLGDSVSYMCPNCLMEKRKTGNEGFVSATTKKMQAVDLPRTTLSDFIERRVVEQLERSYRDTSFKLNQTYEEVEKCPTLILRQVSCYDKNHNTREAMLERYKSKNYPAEFPCRTKCLILFQNIDGQDTLLFGMYVYEYGHNCPQPNQRRCYISYLDSVHYFRPKQYRTVVYHEILVAYLEYMKARGFHTAHIWACPPLKGDDYILYCHPCDQKTPKDDKLRKWYVDMLEICKQRGIMIDCSDIFTEYLADPTIDATALPYFEGDYWVSEAEVIIRDLGNLTITDDSIIDEPEDGGQKFKRKSKADKAKRTRSSRGASTSITLPGGAKIDRDPVMAKLASIIEPMKEAFFVCRMHPKEYADKCAEILQSEVEASHSTQGVANEKKRDEELQAEALTGNDIGIRSDVPSKSIEEGSSTAMEIVKSSEVIPSMSEMKVEVGEIESKEDDKEELKAQMVSVKPVPVSDSKSGRSWHAEDHASVRSGVLTNILRIKKEKIENPSDEWLTALPDVAKKLEIALYMSSTSLEEYMDESSLPQRVEKMESSVEENKFVKGWHSADHLMARQETTSHIIELLKSKAPNSNEEWLRSLPEKARRLESNLYGSALSLEEYSNKTTLKLRLQQLAKSMSVRPEAAKDEVALSSSAGNTGESVVKAEPKSEQSFLPNGLPRFRDDTEDIDDVQESEHFDTRQSFLNLCQGNHYQFDQLRRAKHTSMMVLYHLHNPDAPKFVPSCTNCHKDILIGNRQHCESCDIDFCDECYHLNGPRIHAHPLRVIALGPSAPPKQFTEEQRRERQRSIALHLQLLAHASTCTTENCSSKNCQKMKEFLKHGSTCKVTVKKGCPVCKRILNLLQLHARSCKLELCSVPKCREIREHQRMQTMRQQAMDDRRRAMMNEMYSRPVGAPPVNEDVEEE